ncbi:MAG: calcium/sodium antiporter [Pseudomonadales bacterium]|nr:calcium/sodium antiporter [Pseudomonadales bacterium]
MLSSLFFLIIGFILLGAGAELLVGGSSRLALRLGVTPLVVGLTIVAFGTSAPELAVSIDSTLSGLGALALGNVIGSNIANIGLILGVTALIQPIHIELELVRKQIPIVIACSVMLGLLLLDGSLSRLDGILLVAGLAAYLFLNYRQGKNELPAESAIPLPEVVAPRKPGSTWLNILFIIAGLALLVFGSHMFVEQAVSIARLMGISEAIIGLTLVAIGTSIPELATSVLAAFRRQSDIAIGNVVGSNTFNILCVLGLTSLVGSISGEQFSLLDFGTMLVFACVLLPLARSSFTLTRSEGAILLIAYAAYIGYIATQG